MMWNPEGIGIPLVGIRENIASPESNALETRLVIRNLILKPGY